jgi:Domain of unknown function (DUF4439)
MSGHVPQSAPATVRALQAALTAEHATIYGYGIVGAYLSGNSQATATTDWVAHQVARDRLEAMLRSLGAQPAAAAVAYQLPAPVHSASEAVSLAVLLEDRITAAYLGLVALSNASIRDFGARQVQASALRAAAWRGGTVAFPGMTPAALAAPRKQS